MKNLCFSSINKEQLLPFQIPASENIIVFCAFAGSVATLSAWKSALFEKISLSERSEFEIFLNNAASQIPRITMNPQMRPKSLPIPSLCTGKLTYIPFSTACRIVCLLPSSQETYLIESSKSPVVVAKSNK